MRIRAMLHDLFMLHVELSHPRHGELLITSRRAPWRWLVGHNPRVYRRPSDQAPWVEITMAEFEELARNVDD